MYPSQIYQAYALLIRIYTLARIYVILIDLDELNIAMTYDDLQKNGALRYLLAERERERVLVVEEG